MPGTFADIVGDGDGDVFTSQSFSLSLQSGGSVAPG
jgi:hypothetical protein